MQRCDEGGDAEDPQDVEDDGGQDVHGPPLVDGVNAAI